MSQTKLPEYEISRREFLRLSALALAGSALSACTRSGEILIPSTQTPLDTQTSPITPASLSNPTKSRVAAIRGKSLCDLTRQVIEELGGMRKIISPGESVFIKPNMVTLPWASEGRNPFLLGECVKPEIVITVAEECLKAGAREVIIGDGSQMPRFDWKYATTLDNSTNLVRLADDLNPKYKAKV